MKDLALLMLMADKVAQKKFGKVNIKKNDLNILSEIYDFFYKYIDSLTLDLSPQEKVKIWNKNTINLCFKTYLYQHHKFKISNQLLEKICR
ncbi:MAG: hypothetical protein RIQ65_556 [Pseudomonadota bacterium]